MFSTSPVTPECNILATWLIEFRANVRDEEGGSGLTSENIVFEVASSNTTGLVSYGFVYNETTGEFFHGLFPPITNGRYTFYLNVTDRFENDSHAISCVLVDTLPPVIEQMYPAENAKLSYTEDFSVKIKVYDDDCSNSCSGLDLSKLEFVIDGNTLLPSEYTLSSQSATDSIWVEYPYGNIEDGQHSARIKIFDEAGHFTEKEWNFNYDTQPPKIVDAYPPINSYINYSPTYISVTLDDGVNGTGVASDTISLDILNATGTLSFDENTGVARYDLSQYLPDRPHQITFYAEDKAGNITSWSWTIYVDTDPPEVTLLSPAPESILNSGQIDVQIQIVNYDFSEVSTDTIVLKVGTQDLSGEAYFDTETNLLTVDALTLDDGQYEIYVYVEDTTGNPVDATWPITIDSHPPTLEIVQPVDGGIFDLYPPTEVVVSAADYPSGTGIDETSIEMRINDIKVVADYDEVNNQITYLKPGGFGEGNFSIYVYAEDYSGNGVSTSSSFVVDHSPPLIVGKTPEPGSVIALGEIKEISAFVDDLSGVSSFKLEVNGIDRTSEATFDSEIVKITYTGGGTGFELGNYSVRLFVWDGTGRMSYDTWSFAVVGDMPWYEVVYPEGIEDVIALPSGPSSGEPTSYKELPNEVRVILHSADYVITADMIKVMLYYSTGGAGTYFSYTDQWELDFSYDQTTGEIVVDPTSIGSINQGTYRIFYRTTINTSAGVKKIDKYINIIVDWTPPEISPYPLPDSTFSSLPTVIYARFDDKYSRMIYEVADMYINGGLATKGECDHFVAMGEGYIYRPLCLWNNDLLVHGENNIEIHAWDTAGNETVETFKWYWVSEPAKVASGFSFEPMAINPSQGESVTLKFRLLEKSEVLLHVTQRYGYEFVKIISEEVLPKGEYTYVWNGKDYMGNPVPDGVYNIEGGARALTGSIEGESFIKERYHYVPEFTVNSPTTPVYPEQNIVAEFTYSVTHPALLRDIRIGTSTWVGGATDLSGFLFRSLEVFKPKMPGTYTGIWDGRDEQGNPIDMSVLYENYSASAEDIEFSIGGSLDVIYSNQIIVYGNTPEISKVGVFPIAFNPVHGEITTVTYSLSEDCDVTLTVYNEQEDILRTMYASGTEGLNSITWDGKNENGGILDDGMYKIRVDAKDYDGFEAYRWYVSAHIYTPKVTGVEQDGTIRGEANPGNVTRVYLDNDELQVEPELNGTIFGAAADLTPGDHLVRIEVDSVYSTTPYVTTQNIYFTEITDVSLSESTYNPYTREDLKIDFTIATDETVTVKIVDSSDVTVATLIDGEAKPAGSYSLYWDGKDDSGDYVSDGTYTLVIEIEDEGLNYVLLPSARKDFVVNIGPVIYDVIATNISPGVVAITWSTDIPATSKVEYGPTNEYGSETFENLTMDKNHSRIIDGLSIGTYHFRLYGEAADFTYAFSEDYTVEVTQ